MGSGDLYIGLMSGTSLDGVDAVLVRIGDEPALQVLAHAACPFDAELRNTLLSLNQSGHDELHRASLAANALARTSAALVHRLLADSGTPVSRIVAVASHGQTVRHQPQLHDATGYTLQINNPALLAELCGIDVVADFRSRDVAAGGQGAPLVPAFHQEIFGRSDACVAVLNIGGISNLSVLSPLGACAAGGIEAKRVGKEPNLRPVLRTVAPGYCRKNGCRKWVQSGDFSPPVAADTLLPRRLLAPIQGWDCGPGNALIDHWCQLHTGQPYDHEGQWASQGQVLPDLLESLLQEAYLHQAPPKSTGRDLFNPAWLTQHLHALGKAMHPRDVQATLTALTAQACIRDVQRYAPQAQELIVCGGGALNLHLLNLLRQGLPAQQVVSSATRGLPPLQVEAAAFAWLASKFMRRSSASLPSVTGAQGARVLGALYPR